MLQFFFINKLWMLAIIVNDRFEHRTRLLVESVQSPRQCEYLAIRFILLILHFDLRVQCYSLKAVTPRGDTRWSFRPCHACPLAKRIHAFIALAPAQVARK